MHPFLKALIRCLQQLITLLQKQIHESTSEGDSLINTLAPKTLTEKEDIIRVKPYLDSLKKAIKTNGINNIAITGSYGSGKSTIIKTFQNQNPQFEYLNISLASFSDNKEDKKEFERKLEVSILQQMFYHVKPSVIPDSRFKRIVNITRKKLLFITTFLILWVLSAVLLLKFEYIEQLNPSKWDINQPIDWIATISTIVFLTGIGLFGKNIYRTFSNSSINKLSIKGEIEIGKEVDKSVFNQHLEEILYFFERTQFNVVVIEDVDRFKSTDIFTKLREINILLNNSNLIQRPIKFVYAIKDEMFNDKSERVKFFEFIIPIISFINPGNANDQLTKLISNAKIQGDELSHDFTSDIVTFIDDIDMRLLINIFQEYQIYRKILSSDLKQDNLFAMLVYKNMYPHDFGELGKRKGNLYKFFNQKNTYIMDLVGKHKSEIERIDKQILFLEDEPEISIKELRAVYINLLVSKMTQFHCFYIDYKSINLNEALEDDNFNLLKNSKNIEYQRYEVVHYNTLQYSNRKSNITFSSIENEVLSGNTYDDRERIILDKAIGKINSLKIEREAIKSEISETESLSIKEIFELVDISNHLGEFKESYLMRNLILNGHIDEFYDDYISLFHGVSLTNADFSFERCVKGGKSLPFDYKLTKTENLIKKLPEKYFKREVILNFTLLECLLENDIKFKSRLNNFYLGLNVKVKKQFEFIHEFIKKSPKHLGAFIKEICNYKPEIWNYFYEESGLPDNEIRDFIKLIFENADKESILKFEKVNSLSDYLAKMQDFFGFSANLNRTDTLSQCIKSLYIRFESLDLPNEKQKKLFELVYRNSCYKLNVHNIQIIIEGNGIEYNQIEFEKSHYTSILKLKLVFLTDYIETYLEKYIKVVLLAIEGNKKESEEVIITILNSTGIKIDIKEKFIKKQENLIHSINDIDDINVKQLALANNSIVSSWENVFDYYDNVEGEDLDEVLISYLNNLVTYEVLCKEKLNFNTAHDEEYIKKISQSILHCEKLNIEAYAHLLDSIPYNYNRLIYEKLDSSKISKLLDKKVLSLTGDNFNGLKSKDKNFALRLIEIHQSRLLEKLPELTLEISDWLNIFMSKVITQANKISLVQKIDDNIIINNANISDEVCNILPIDTLIPLRFEVLEAMFKSNNSVQKRISLLNLHFSNLDDAQVQSLSEKLGEDYAKMFIKQHKPVFPNNIFNSEFFKKLKERDLIIRFESENKGKVLRVFAKY